MWVDTHCHLDAAEFNQDRLSVLNKARQHGIQQIVMPAVQLADFSPLRQIAQQTGLAYGCGIHPLYVQQAELADLPSMYEYLQHNQADPQLVAVGEIGLDYFIPEPDQARQEYFYVAQLKMARALGLPVLLHSRRSVDAILKGLRQVGVVGGIAHAFNGSLQQAQQLIDLGFKLGFGGACTFERALHLRRLVAELPLDAIVLETDAPDMPPQWLYQTAAQRALDAKHRNEPAELVPIAAQIASLRQIDLAEFAQVTTANAHAVLPRLKLLHAVGLAQSSGVQPH